MYMVQCEFCLHYNGTVCTNSAGTKYGEVLEDSYEHINCPAYIDKGFAGAMTPAFDDYFFDIFWLNSVKNFSDILYYARRFQKDAEEEIEECGTL